MSEEGNMDWSASPTSWAAVFEGGDESGAEESTADRVAPQATSVSATDTSLVLFNKDVATRNSAGSSFRFLGSPYVNASWGLNTIVESADSEAEAEDKDKDEDASTKDEEDEEMAMKRSVSCANIDGQNAQGGPIRMADNKHVVAGSVPMQFVHSLPNSRVTSPVYPPADIPPVPKWGMIAYSAVTGIMIVEKHDVPDVLRPRPSPPKAIAEIKAMPVWAQPPIEARYIRADWGDVNPNYRAKIVKEFGPDLFYQMPGWWQEVLKGDHGRIVVKTDDHYYTVFCHLPGQTLEGVTVYQAKGTLGIQTDCYIRNEHFHWKIDLPRVNFSYIHAAMKGDTLTVQIRKQTFQERLEMLNFDPMTCVVAPTDMIPMAVYGL